MKFAYCNIGASALYEYGGYYSLGETEEKDGYSGNVELHPGTTIINSNVRINVPE